MCDCQADLSPDTDAPLWWKLVAGLVLGGLIADLLIPEE